MSDRITALFAKPQPWQQEFAQLRSLLLACGLEEGYKWGWPCYMQEGANIVLMHGFKQYCALLLFKGASAPTCYTSAKPSSRPRALRACRTAFPASSKAKD